MSASTNDLTPTPSETGKTYPLDPTDTPIPLWPEGLLAALAGLTLILIGLRHRSWLQRKGREVQAAVNEFQKQGGLDELQQVAAHASELLKGKGA